MTTKFESAIDWLTYRSYEFNRFNAPSVPYYKWRAVYEDAIIFEEIYEENLVRIQQEKGIIHECIN